jgi:methyl-accepting chemotaxis protein
MHDVVSSIGRVTDIMAEISAASQEQTAGIEQVNQAVSQMDTVTQQNAGLVEEAASASEALQNQAVKLAELVSVFRVDDRAVAAAPSAAPRATPAVAALARPVSRPPAKPAIRSTPINTTAKIPATTADDGWEEF